MLRQMGVDEIYLGKKQKFLTVVSNLETGEPLWFGRERKKGGTLTDTVYRKTGKLKFARRIVAAPAMLASGACLIPAAMTHSAWTAILCLTASLFFLELVISPAWAVPMDVGGEFSGTVSGVMNMAGSLAASLSPIIFGALVQRGFWITPFVITAGVLLAGALIWAFLIDPERSVVVGVTPRIPTL